MEKSEKDHGEQSPEVEATQEQGPKPAGIERRRFPRYHVGIPVKVRVLVEEQTFSPFSFAATCDNLSRSGALVTAREFPRDKFVLLIRHPRYVRITCTVPISEKTLVLFGKVVWYDYKEADPNSPCKLGVNFERMKPDDMVLLQQYIGSIADPSAEVD